MKNMILAAFAALALTACTDRYGRVDYGRTALLGIGVGGAGALAAGALSDDGRGYRRSYGYGGSVPYGRPGPGYGRGGYYGGW